MVLKTLLEEKFLKSKSKLNIVFDIAVIILFGLVFFSLPAFSSTSEVSLITWVLTILLLIAQVASLILFYRVRITLISCSFILFGISALISSLLNGMDNFLFTPIFLSLFSFFIYSYCLENKDSTKPLIYSAYIGVIFFLGLFIIRYRNELFPIGSDRLGRLFGDENDIALFMAFGTTMSMYLLFKVRWRFKIIYFLLACAFGYCGLSSGSKIFLILVAIIFVIIVCLYFGLKKWWLSLILIVGFVGLIIGLLQIPMLKPLKDRFLDFFNSMFGIGESVSAMDVSSVKRLDFFLCGIEMFGRKPLFGYGIWGFANYSSINNNGWSHNQFSETLCNFGIVGTFFFHYGFVVSLISYFKNKNKKEVNLAFILMSFFFVAMFSVALNSQKLYAYLIGIAYAMVDTSKKYIAINFKEKKKSELSTLEKMKLVELTPYLFPVGGGQTLFANLCKEIKLNHSNEVDLVVVFLYSKEDCYLYDELEKEHIPMYFLDKKKGLDLRCAHRLRKLLKEINPDIVHSHLDTSVTLFCASHFRKKYKIYHTIHHMVGDGFQAEKLNIFLTKKGWLTPIGVGQQSALSMEKATGKKCQYVYNGIDLAKYDYSKPIKDREIDFLCVGSLYPIKNHPFLFSCFKEFHKTNPTSKLVVLGEGVYRENYEEIVSQYGLSDFIIFKGCVDNVSEYMANSKILLISSITEGNPMVVYEASASGMYIISTAVGGVLNIVQDGVNGDLVTLNDQENYVKKMIERINDIDFLENNRLKNYVEKQHFSIENTANEYIEIFKKGE